VVSAPRLRLLPVLVAIGLGFRLLFLGKRQLWTDELMQALVVRGGTLEEILTRLRDGMALPAPLDYLVQKGIVFLVGEAPWSLRLHAVLFGTLSLWVFYRIARRMFGERVALYSTALFVFFPLHYHYSQEGRPYALFLLLTLVAFDLLLAMLAGEVRGPRAWLSMGLVLTLGLYASLLGAFLILTQLLALGLLARRRRAPTGAKAESPAGPDLPVPDWPMVMKYAGVATVALLLFVPWLQFTWQAPRVAPAREIVHPKLLLRIFKELGDNSYPMSLLLVVGVTTGVRALRRHGRTNALLLLTVWAGTTIIPLLAAELGAGYFFAIRHILHATPALVLLVGYGLSYVGERLTILPHLPYRVSAPAIAYAGLSILISIFIAASHWRSEPVDWRGTALLLEQNLRPGEVVAMPRIYMLLEYHAPRLESFRVDDLSPGPGLLARENVRRRYVVCLDGLSPDPCSRFRTAVARDTAWSKQPLRGFMLFRRDKAGPP
jgi:hypothetical protein